jgi:MFS family permease
MRNSLGSFLGFGNPYDVVLKFMLVFSIIGTSFTVISTLSTTFYVIFVAETIGQGSYVDGLAIVGTLIVVRMAVQLILDYPSGIVGDWIGQRYVLASSFFTYAISYYIVSLITYSTSLAYLLIVYAIMGFASSQNSGALSFWFDNNYQRLAPDDARKKRYGVFKETI